MFVENSLVLLTVLSVVHSQSRLSDLVARLSPEITTKGPLGLDSLLDSYEKDRELTHMKSWNKLDVHHRKSLSSLLDEYYPDEANKGRLLDDDFMKITTQGPFFNHKGSKSRHAEHESKDVTRTRHADHELRDGHRSMSDHDSSEEHSKNRHSDHEGHSKSRHSDHEGHSKSRHSDHDKIEDHHKNKHLQEPTELERSHQTDCISHSSDESSTSLIDDESRTTPGPLLDGSSSETTSSSSEESRKSLNPDVPTRHHHRYHRGDGLLPHQPQADSSFQPSVRGYYDYSTGNPTSKSGRSGTVDWKKTVAGLRNGWTLSSNKKSGVIGSVPKSDTDDETSAQRLAHRHVKAARDMTCRLPQAKIIRVSDHYPSPDKLYFPSCTRLHQCAQDTGCCPPSQRCGPRATQRVELYFFVTSLRGGSESGSRMKADKLTFYNHTECVCQDRNDEMPRDHEELSVNSIDSHYTLDPGGRHMCLCPSEFTLKFMPNGSCACDCFDKQKECTKYKRGKEFFKHKDKLCIVSNKCVVPMCDYGTYSRRYGRCPRKHERHKGSWFSRYN